MKNSLTAIFLVVVLLITTRQYLHSGLPYTHDGENHVARFANYKLALKEGQLPPRFAPNLMNRYGYPVFNFNYPLPSIVSLPFSILKIPYVTSFKLIMILAVLGGLLGVLQLAKVYQVPFSSKIMALGIYGLNPYLMSAILFRGSIGEVLVIGLIPWLWWFIRHCREESYTKVSVLGALLSAAFFLSHNVGVLLVTPLLLVIAVVTLRDSRDGWKRLFVSVGLGAFLSLWFWLPALFEKSLIVLDQAGLSNSAILHFPTTLQLLFAPMTFGFSYPGTVDSLSFTLGLAQIMVLVVGSIILIKRSLSSGKVSVLPAMLLLLIVGLVLGQTVLSAFGWNTLPLVRFIQFPWRLSLAIAPLLAGLVLLQFRYWPKSTQISLAGLLILQAFYFSRLKPVDYRYATNIDYESFSQSTTTANENLPKSFTYQEISDWQPTAQILEGQGEASMQYWKGSDRQYTLKLQSESIIVEPTMLFAGWETKVTKNNSVSKVEYLDTEIVQGRLSYRLPAGEYLVRSRFTQWTVPRIIGNGISLVGLLVLISVGYAQFIKRKQRALKG